jgi:hypothetical protein
VQQENHLDYLVVKDMRGSSFSVFSSRFYQDAAFNVPQLEPVSARRIRSIKIDEEFGGQFWTLPTFARVAGQLDGSTVIGVG